MINQKNRDHFENKEEDHLVQLERQVPHELFIFPVVSIQPLEIYSLGEVPSLVTALLGFK